MRGNIQVLGSHEEGQGLDRRGGGDGAESGWSGALRTEGPIPPPGSRVTGVEQACAAGAPATHMSRPVPGSNSQGGAPRLFRCQVVMAALGLTLSASLFPVAQRTSGSTPLRTKPLWRRPASASAPAGNGGALPLLPPQPVTAASEGPLPASACNGGALSHFRSLPAVAALLATSASTCSVAVSYSWLALAAPRLQRK